ncbi:hypothetical protein CNR22_18495 [Sphingobacteriaceae bacterium]|nr:hypothetical protein CNR22_18495 [Sphingobacteriaceae bacterium]
MKKIILFSFILQALTIAAQSRRPARMAQVFVNGYYVNVKGDTVKGKVQINPDDEIEFYKQFAFLAPKSKKSKSFTTSSRIKGYGFENRDFVMVDYQGEKLFVERLAMGRLRFYEMRFHGKIDGNPAIESAYFIKDTGAEGEEKYLGEIRKISTKYYKKALKPYLKDQLMIWSDLDKYTFNEQTLLNAIKEFNAYYATTAN